MRHLQCRIKFTKSQFQYGKRIKRGLFKSIRGLMNADVNGSLNILRLGTNKNFKIENKFNPIKITNINELNDVCYFNYSEPVDIGQVFCPNRKLYEESCS